MYDLIVIGLGPAGASALYTSAKTGLKVLGVDKKREIGVPIQCGEFLPADDEYNNILPKAKHLELLKNFPKDFIKCHIYRVSLYSPNGIKYCDRFHGYVIDRETFDKWIVYKAIECGADVKINTTVIGITRRNNIYTIKAHSLSGYVELKARAVIAASGASSNILPMLNLPKEDNPYNLASTMQYVMAGYEGDINEVEMYTGSRYAPGAYAWIIPRGEGFANVGVGVRSPFIKKIDRNCNVKSFLDRFIREHPIASTKLKKAKAVSITGGIVPVGPPLKSYNESSIAVGDAANQVIACIGAGVPTAVIAGSIAGEVIALHITDNIPLSEYWNITYKEIGDALENGYKIRLAIDLMCRSDKILEKSIEYVCSRSYTDLIRVRIPKGINLIALASKIIGEFSH